MTNDAPAPARANTGLKFNYPRTMLIGLAFFAISLFWQTYYYIAPMILSEHIDSNLVINTIMSVENILALFMLPMIGALSDRTVSRFGKRMPYIVPGAIAAALMLGLTALTNASQSLPLILVTLMGAVVFMATFRSPAVALMPDLTPKPLRSQGNAVINIMGVIGGILAVMVLIPAFVHSQLRVDDTGATVLNKYGEPIKDYLGTSPWLFVIVAMLMVAAVVVLCIFIRERPLHERLKDECARAGYDLAGESDDTPATTIPGQLERAKRTSLILILVSIFLWFFGYNGITTMASRYGYAVWATDQIPFALTIAQVLAFAGAIPAGILGARLGRKRTIMIGIVVLATGFGALYFFEAFSSGMFVFFGLIGIGWIFINVNSFPMVVELARGADIGKYTGYYYLFSMTSQLVTKYVIGGLTDAFGFWLIFPYGAFFATASLVTMAFVRQSSSSTKTSA